jgi:predicted nucleic acid-binding Zn ribbon protein
VTEAPEEPAAPPSAEELADRERRADKATRMALAAVLGLEAVVVLLIPRAIAFTTGLGPLRTGVCIGLAVVLALAAGLLRRPWGVGVGSGLQLAVFATGAMITTMFVIAALLMAVWLRVLMLRHEIAGRPGGVRMLLG